jgi:hypothetical protein
MTILRLVTVFRSAVAAELGQGPHPRAISRRIQERESPFVSLEAAAPHSGCLGTRSGSSAGRQRRHRRRHPQERPELHVGRVVGDRNDGERPAGREPAANNGLYSTLTRVDGFAARRGPTLTRLTGRLRSDSSCHRPCAGAEDLPARLPDDPGRWYRPVKLIDLEGDGSEHHGLLGISPFPNDRLARFRTGDAGHDAELPP